MKKLLSLFASLMALTLSYSQDHHKVSPLTGLLKADISLQGIGISYDAKTGNNMTIEFATGAGGGYDIAEENFNYTWSIFKPAFYFYASPKFFYNRTKRFKKGKRTDQNAGNYFGARIKYNTPDVSASGINRDAFLFNLHWGLQRPLGANWAFYTQVGGGYGWDMATGFGTIYPAIDVKFSYIISKRKKT